MTRAFRRLSGCAGAALADFLVNGMATHVVPARGRGCAEEGS